MEDLSLWIEATRAQGDPSLYRHDEIEMYVMRVFDRINFSTAGKSQRERRRSFGEIWDAAGGNTDAIAYGFNAALNQRIYSIKYVKGCIKNRLAFLALPEAVRKLDIFTQPKIVKDTPEVRPKLPLKSEKIEIPKTAPTPAAKKSRSKKPMEATPPVEVKW